MWHTNDFTHFCVEMNALEWPYLPEQWLWGLPLDFVLYTQTHTYTHTHTHTHTHRNTREEAHRQHVWNGWWENEPDTNSRKLIVPSAMNHVQVNPVLKRTILFRNGRNWASWYNFTLSFLKSCIFKNLYVLVGEKLTFLEMHDFHDYGGHLMKASIIKRDVRLMYVTSSSLHSGKYSERTPNGASSGLKASDYIWIQDNKWGYLQTSGRFGICMCYVQILRQHLWLRMYRLWMSLPGAGNLMMSGAASGRQRGRASKDEGSPGMISHSPLVSPSLGRMGTCWTKATERWIWVIHNP